MKVRLDDLKKAKFSEIDEEKEKLLGGKRRCFGQHPKRDKKDGFREIM
jgi:hypothetical protein